MKKNVAVIFGGRSVEHEVSIVSANQVMKWLASADFDVTPMYINKKGKWIISGELKNLEFFKNEANLESNLELPLIEDNKIIVKAGLFFKKTVKIDILFPVMHGSHGEDGVIPAFCELLNLPYVGCDKTSSVLCMNKVLTNQIVETINIPKVEWISFDSAEIKNNNEEVIVKILRKFNLSREKFEPLFVKPVNLGSSIGVSKVKNIDELKNSLEVVSYLDKQCIIEKSVENLLEVNCALIGNNDPITSLLESPNKNSEFLTFEDKYISGSMKGKSVEIPAPLDDMTTKNIQEMCVKIYKTLNCSGISRIDLLYDRNENKVYFNEINPMPGSLQAHLWRASGITPTELVKKLVAFAEEKYETDNKLNTIFSSQILTNAMMGKSGGKKM